MVNPAKVSDCLWAKTANLAKSMADFAKILMNFIEI